MKNFLTPLAVAFCVVGISHATTPALPTKTFTTNFVESAKGWSAGFADYPAGSEEFYELKSGMRMLPRSIKLKRKAFFISGNNHSDDLCMFMTRKVSGLKPNTRYKVQFSVSFASASPEDAFGVGGSPAITVKAGVCHVRPKVEGEDSLLNIDKGNQSQGGKDAMVIGDTGVNVPTDPTTYRMKTLSNKGEPFVFKTDATGKAWLFVATDSGFEATTSLYVTRISARFLER